MSTRIIGGQAASWPTQQLPSKFSSGFQGALIADWRPTLAVHGTAPQESASLQPVPASASSCAPDWRRGLCVYRCLLLLLLLLLQLQTCMYLSIHLCMCMYVFMYLCTYMYGRWGRRRGSRRWVLTCPPNTPHCPLVGRAHRALASTEARGNSSGRGSNRGRGPQCTCLNKRRARRANRAGGHVNE